MTVIMLFLMLIIGCSKSPTPPTLVEDISTYDLRIFLRSNNIQPTTIVFADHNYTITDEKYFVDNILNNHGQFLFDNGISRAKEPKNDCTKFARGFSFYSRMVVSKENSIKYQIPVGDIYYSILFNKGHAINLVLVLDNNTHQKKIIYIEPQNDTIINTNNSDIDNVDFEIEYMGM
jgi:hypothetical protein